MEAIRFIRSKCYMSRPPADITGDLVYHNHACIQWKIKRSDFNFQTATSPEFCFQLSKLRLMFSSSSTRDVTICMRKAALYEGKYKFETYILDKNGLKRYPVIHEINVPQGNISANCELNVRSYLNSYIWRMDYTIFFSDLDSLLTNGVLNIVCTINYAECYCKSHETGTSTELYESSLDKMASDIGKLYDNEEQSDVILTCGNNTIRAHKNILSTRSEVFAAMFRNPMVECKDGIVEIPDVQFHILNHLLQYIYSGKMNYVSGDTALQLYEAADKYAIQTLKSKCASVLLKEITEENVCDILFLAYLHSDEDLKKNVIRFIQKERKILLNKQWIDFSKRNPDLAVEVYDIFLQQLPLI